MPAESTALRSDDWMWDDTVIAAPSGHLDAATYRQLRDHLTKLGTDHPRAVVVDLNGLDIASVGPLAIFSTVHLRLARWPGVPLLLAAGNLHSRQLLATSRIGRFVPVHETVGAAVAAVDEPPPRKMAKTMLPNGLASPRLAREFAQRICLEWELPALADDAMLVIGELVSNAVVHTPSAPSIRIELRRGVLSVAVYDDVPGEVYLVDPGAGMFAIHGLLLVAQMATAWGCAPTSAGGKVVWAALRAGPVRSPK